jgi:hypothetical protein
VPIFGLTKDRIRKESPKEKITTFKIALNVEVVGAILDNNPASAKCRCFFLFHKTSPTNTNNTRRRTAKK